MEQEDHLLRLLGNINANITGLCEEVSGMASDVSAIANYRDPRTSSMGVKDEPYSLEYHASTLNHVVTADNGGDLLCSHAPCRGVGKVIDNLARGATVGSILRSIVSHQNLYSDSPRE